jgi:hypothetical protein
MSLHDKLFIFIVGGESAVRGCGKTSLAAHIACERMTPPQRDIDLAKCRKKIAELRAGGWNNLSLEDHVKHTVYVADDTFTSAGMGYKPQVSMELKFDELGLWDGVHTVTHILPCSTVVVPEVQSKLDCRKSMKGEEGLRDNLSRFIELQRKFGVRMIADSQFYTSTEKRLRESADLVIEVQQQEHKQDKWGEIIQTTWNVFEFDGAARYEKYRESRDLAKWGRKAKYVHKGDIYKCYDSLAGHEYFTNGMTGNFHTTVSKVSTHNKKDMDEKCAKFPIAKPITQPKIKKGKTA